MSPELSGVYGRIHDSRQDIETGIQLILAGDEVAGRNQLAAAATRLFVAARECAETPGCDMDLCTEAMAQLLDERRLAMAAAVTTPVVFGPAAPLDEAEPLDQPATLPRGESLLSGADLEELIPMNQQVRAALNDWLTWNRPGLIEAHGNYRFLRPGVAPVYEAAELPEALLFAMMAKESGVKVHAYSKAGAAGPLQFMPRTALRYGLGSNDGFDNRLDPVAATRANAAYMKRLLNGFGGNLELALAAYNVGETRLRRIHRKHGGAGFWDPRVYYSLPWETRNYVPKVLAAAWLFLHAEDHGLDLQAGEISSTTIVLENVASLGELSICLAQVGNPDGWFRTLRNLNPRVSPGKRLPAGAGLVLPTPLVPIYNERCTGDTPLVRLAGELHDADYPARPEVMPYQVQRGDTLAEIAVRHRCSLRELAELNDIEGPGYVILIGQQLTVPTRG